MAETKIKGLKIIIEKDFILIYDAYQINNKNKMQEIINEAKNKIENCYIDRQMNSIIKEWFGRNRLYRWKICKKKMKDFKIKNDTTIIKNILFTLIGFPPIKNIIKKIIIQRKENAYYKYIEKHRNFIMQAYLEMLTCPTVLSLGEKVLEELKKRIVLHDLSKYSKQEFDAYRKYYYPINKKEKENSKENFDAAWLHHWSTNPHHWQYRQNKTNFSKDNLNDIVNVLENICDWLAMGYNFNNRPYQYYEENKNQIKLCPEEKKFLEYIIYEGIDRKFVKTREEENNE